MKRALSMALVLVMMAAAPVEAAASVGDVVGNLAEKFTELDLRLIVNTAQEYARAGALELKLVEGGLSTAAAAKGATILAEMKTGLAATGISAVEAAGSVTIFATAGIGLVTADYEAYWDTVFNRDDFLSNDFVYKSDLLSTVLTNYHHADEIGNWVREFPFSLPGDVMAFFEALSA